jgi:dTDP-4-amino-4,6-dideoxygalactose transaminase
MQELLNRGISSRRGIMASHRERPYSEVRWTKELKETDSVADNCIVLPLYHTMTEEDQDYVIDSIREISAVQ